jgi:hypothetical protein
MPAAIDTQPMAMPATTAVPVERLTASRHSWSFELLYRTVSGSVARPRETLSATEYVT